MAHKLLTLKYKTIPNIHKFCKEIMKQDMFWKSQYQQKHIEPNANVRQAVRRFIHTMAIDIGYGCEGLDATPDNTERRFIRAKAKFMCNGTCNTTGIDTDKSYRIPDFETIKMCKQCTHLIYKTQGNKVRSQGGCPTCGEIQHELQQIQGAPCYMCQMMWLLINNSTKDRVIQQVQLWTDENE